eukprot:gene14047-18597_t
MSLGGGSDAGHSVLQIRTDSQFESDNGYRALRRSNQGSEMDSGQA